MAEEKIRSIGLKKALFGEINADGGMPTEMKQLSRTLKGTASFVSEPDTTVEFYCEEEPTTPVESIANESGLKQVKLNLLEWDNQVLIFLFGGTESAATDVTIDGKTYTVKKYKAPKDIVTIKRALRVISHFNVVIDIPVALITARFQWTLTKDQIAQIEITAKALSPIGEDDGPYEIYKLGEPKAATGG